MLKVDFGNEELSTLELCRDFSDAVGNVINREPTIQSFREYILSPTNVTNIENAVSVIQIFENHRYRYSEISAIDS